MVKLWSEDIFTFLEVSLDQESYFDKSRNMKTDSPHTPLLLDMPLDTSVAASQFAALGSEQRLAVLRILVRAGEEGVTIGVLGERSGVTGSTLTHHMKILAAAGLVTQQKQGRSIICAAADYDVMRALSDYLLLECCADKTDCAHKKG